MLGKKLLLGAVILAAAMSWLWAGNGIQQNIRTLNPVKAAMPPVLDGVLDDAVWQEIEALEDVWITYNPANGDRLPQRTRVYMAYDDKNIYFAFHCLDSEPNKIKTSLTKHDNMFEDDWVGLSLDTAGTQQYGYEWFVNPSGAQGDIFRTGDAEDSSTDWVWYSAGKIVADGYIVEIRQPLQSIRFASGKDVKMGVVFWRRISRLGMSGSWPQLVPGKGIAGSQARVVFAQLERPLVLEALPSFTYSSGWDRLSPLAWSKADQTRDLGIGLKYGITSSIVAEATLNPDFSQVESDSLQVTVNQRYPIFYAEKRPFFMEAGNFFNLAKSNGLPNMDTSVHTRTIVDPQWGARLTGEQGKASFALLAASDRSPGRSWGNGEENPYLGSQATFWIGRGKYGLGGDNYCGVLYSGREFGDEYNRSLAGDISYRFRKYHQVMAYFIQSYSNRPDAGGKVQGDYLTAQYLFNKKNTYLALLGEYAAPNFQMDTAFYNRTGISDVKFYISQGFVPNQKKIPWLFRIEPNLYAYFLHDRTSGMDDKGVQLQVNFNFALEGNAGVTLETAQESWAGQEFHKLFTDLYVNLQPFKWLSFHSCFGSGDSIYYDPEEPFLGRRQQWHLQFNLQPNENLNLLAERIINTFDRAHSGARVYEEDIWRGRLTYQFNEHLFVRGLVQYDSFYRMVLGDALAAFTYIPGTVIYLGYGSLNERQTWLEGRWQRDADVGRYYLTRQSLFFKVSYRYQF